MERKYYNWETRFRSLKDGLRAYLKEIGVYYECSECFDGWHFEIKANEEELTKINNWLDTHTLVSVTE